MLPLIVRPALAELLGVAPNSLDGQRVGRHAALRAGGRRRHLRAARRLPHRPVRPPARARVEHPALRVLGCSPRHLDVGRSAAVLALLHVRRRLRGVRRGRRVAGGALPDPEAARAVVGYTQAFGRSAALMVTGAYYLVVTYGAVAAGGSRRPRGVALHADVGRDSGDSADPHPAVPAGVAGLAARRSAPAR